MNQQVRAAIARLEAFIGGVDDAYALPRDGAQFCHAIMLATGAKRALEIGTGYGYSGLWLAAALAKNGGRLVTIDHSPRKIDAARDALQSAGLVEWVEFRTGNMLDVLPKITGPIDFVLNDADKEHCIEYVELLAPKLSERAVVLTDNIKTHADQLAKFLGWIREHREFFSSPVDVGNGMELSIKLGGGVSQ